MNVHGSRQSRGGFQQTLNLMIARSTRQPLRRDYTHRLASRPARVRPGEPIFSVRHPDGRLGTYTVRQTTEHTVYHPTSTEEDRCKRTQRAPWVGYQSINGSGVAQACRRPEPEERGSSSQFAIAPRGIREIRTSRRSEPGEVERMCAFAAHSHDCTRVVVSIRAAAAAPTEPEP